MWCVAFVFYHVFLLSRSASLQLLIASLGYQLSTTGQCRSGGVTPSSCISSPPPRVLQHSEGVICSFFSPLLGVEHLGTGETINLAVC